MQHMEMIGGFNHENIGMFAVQTLTETRKKTKECVKINQNIKEDKQCIYCRTYKHCKSYLLKHIRKEHMGSIFTN